LPAAADGVGNEEIARRCGADSDTVRRRRKRFLALGPAGVGTLAKGRGRRPSLSEGTVAEVLRLTREERPVDGSTHWAGDARAKGGRTFAGAEPKSPSGSGTRPLHVLLPGPAAARPKAALTGTWPRCPCSPMNGVRER
jgi:hypothetical protein